MANFLGKIEKKRKKKCRILGGIGGTEERVTPGRSLTKPREGPVWLFIISSWISEGLILEKSGGGCRSALAVLFWPHRFQSSSSSSSTTSSRSSGMLTFFFPPSAYPSNREKHRNRRRRRRRRRRARRLSARGRFVPIGPEAPTSNEKARIPFMGYSSNMEPERI